LPTFPSKINELIAIPKLTKTIVLLKRVISLS
jgi:hypothetical protein